MAPPAHTVESQRPGTCLMLHRFGVAFGDHVVLSTVSLELPTRGAVVLLGPTGTGKSTLLRTLAGFNQHIPNLTTWGEAHYGGQPLTAQNAPVLVSQKTRLLTATLQDNLLYETPEQFQTTPAQKRARALQSLEWVGLRHLADSLSHPVVSLPLAAQRLVAIARAVASGPRLLLIDEPTFGLTDADAQAVLEVIRRQATERAVLVVLHNQTQAQQVGGTTALLAGGAVQELQPTGQFFTAPQTASGREFVATGNCSDPSPNANAADLDLGAIARLRPADSRQPVAASASIGPRGFVWLLPGKLAGTPQPGVVADIHSDLQALRRVGVTDLISLTEHPLELTVLSQHGICAHWFPIPDTRAPEITQASAICTRIDELLRKGAVVAVHCRAGLGRTGTILVAYLIWGGRSPMDALETARRLEPKWVQSDHQVRFIENFCVEPGTAPEPAQHDLPPQASPPVEPAQRAGI